MKKDLIITSYLLHK